MKELLENLAVLNFIKNDVSTPVQLSYLDWTHSPTTEEQLENKKELRHSAIDALFDASKIDDFVSAKSKYEESINPFSASPGVSIGSPQTLGLIVKSLTVNPKRITSPELVRDEIVIEWMKHSKVSSTTTLLSSVTSNFNGLLKGNQIRTVETGVPNGTEIEGVSYGYRRMMTKCIQASNMIAVSGRIGPATTILANREILNIFPKLSEDSLNGGIYGKNYQLAGMSLVFSNLVPKDRLYVIRTGKDINNTPMCVVHNTTLNEYCLAIFPSIQANCIEMEII